MVSALVAKRPMYLRDSRNGRNAKILHKFETHRTGTFEVAVPLRAFEVSLHDYPQFLCNSHPPAKCMRLERSESGLVERSCVFCVQDFQIALAATGLIQDAFGLFVMNGRMAACTDIPRELVSQVELHEVDLVG